MKYRRIANTPPPEKELLSIRINGEISVGYYNKHRRTFRCCDMDDMPIEFNASAADEWAILK